MKLRTIVSGATVASIVGVASAGDIYSTGFEGPNFSLGPISGQSGWSGNGVAEGTVVKTGSQALYLDASTSKFVGADYGLSYATGNSIVNFQADYEVSSTVGAQSGISIFGDTGFLAQIDTLGSGIYGLGNSNDGTLGKESFASGVWHHLDIELNFQTEMVTGSVDGYVLGTLAINPPTKATEITGIQLYSYGPGAKNYFGPGANNYFDNVSVTSTPEPFTAALSIGAVGLAVRRKLRKV